MTTPSKPYVPKDDPSTPAVVISEAALADAKRKADRARIAQTIPAQTRSASSASPAPLSSPAAALLDDTETRPRRRSVWPILLGGGVAVAAGIALVLLPSGSPDKPAIATTDARQSVAASNAPAETAPAAAAPAPPPAVEAPEVASAAPTVPDAVAPAEPPAPVVKRRPAKKPATAPAARKSTGSRSSTGEPTSTVAPRAAKGVIVRETPF